MLVFHLDMLASGATPFGEDQIALAAECDPLERGRVIGHYFETILIRRLS
ncbi:hypothetical protein [Caulobacter sp. 17J65-9]|nr:hypothetical protein [Caulobacter sp. 17J65-9]NEX93154.1 hypothetical protein [Caulobacter sp. 17J65-9]